MSRLHLSAALLALSACRSGSDSPITPPVTPPAAVVASLSLTPAAAALVPGQSLSLVATARDATGAVLSTTVTWTSSANTVASVSTDGRVLAITPGTSTITASAGTVSATSSVVVNDGGFITAAGGTISALSGLVRLDVPAGAVSMPVALTIRAVASPPSDPRLLTGTTVSIDPAVTFVTPATLRLRYPSVLDGATVETQLRIAQLSGTTWAESAVVPVDRTTRLVSAPITSSGTWAVFAPLPSLRGYAQLGAFDMGAAVSIDALRSDAVYRRVLAAEYNTVTAENAMKFGPIHPAVGTYAFADADSIVAFAVANNMKVHGHVLLWHSQQPAWLTAGTPTRVSLLAALKEHIETVVGRYAGKTSSWDVANELIADDGTGLRKSFWTTTIGPDVIDSAFTWARRKDPTAKLYLNDYSVELVSAKSDSLLALVRRLKRAGVPLDGVGLQSHFSLPTPSAAQLSTNIARFVAEGLDVRFTELDVRIADGADGLAAQATGYAAVIDACRATRRCTAVTSWGFTDRYSWIPSAFTGFGRALPFDANYVAKPAYLSLRDALARP